MDPTRFDGVAKGLATRSVTRRRTLAAAAASALAAFTGATRGTRSQASPTATGSGTVAANNSTLFVQTASGGTFHPNPQAGQPLPTANATPAAIGTPVAATRGDYLLTLTGHTGETIAFSDRPERMFGEVKTAQFFQSMGFTPANPPNAALVADSPQQEDDVLLIELFHPAYDAVTQTLTYDANILTRYTGELLKPLAAKQTDQRIAAEFTTAALFIDDCPDLTTCYVLGVYPVGPVPQGPVGMCWNWFHLRCLPCNGKSTQYYEQRCNGQYPNECGGACVVYP